MKEIKPGDIWKLPKHGYRLYVVKTRKSKVSDLLILKCSKGTFRQPGYILCLSDAFIREHGEKIN